MVILLFLFLLLLLLPLLPFLFIFLRTNLTPPIRLLATPLIILSPTQAHALPQIPVLVFPVLLHTPSLQEFQALSVSSSWIIIVFLHKFHSLTKQLSPRPP